MQLRATLIRLGVLSEAEGTVVIAGLSNTYSDYTVTFEECVATLPPLYCAMGERLGNVCTVPPPYYFAMGGKPTYFLEVVSA